MKKSREKITRRDLIKGLATLPILGIFGYLFHRKQRVQPVSGHGNLFEVKLPSTTSFHTTASNDRINIGIIGFGWRGESLAKSLGFVHPDWIKSNRLAAEKNPRHMGLKEFLNQEDLNVEIVAACDLYKPRNQRARVISKNTDGPGAAGNNPKGATIYDRYEGVLNNPDVDAVIISTQDHWHERICLDAIRVGKHVYLEKCMGTSLEQAKNIRDAIDRSSITFQLGHQNHQITSHLIANQIIKEEKLGHISLIQGSTDRYRKGGYSGYQDASPETIDWDQYQEPLEIKRPFDPHRFFSWNSYFDYGLGLFGGLFSHEYAAINQIMEMGIPTNLATTGGIYLWKDNFHVPDVFGINLNYPERDLMVMYSLNLGNSHIRRRLFVGTEAIMEASNMVSVYPESTEGRYAKRIKSGEIEADKPVYFWPQDQQVDAVVSATESYFLKKGVYYTYHDGRWVDSSHLHLKDWLNGIRYNTEPRCNVDLGFQETVTCVMATKSYLEGRTVYWDRNKEEII